METLDMLVSIGEHIVILAMMSLMLAFCVAGAVMLAIIAYGFCFGR